MFDSDDKKKNVSLEISSKQFFMTSPGSLLGIEGFEQINTSFFATQQMIRTQYPLSRLLLLIALLIWKSCIYRVIFMTFPITFCLHDNWSQKWVKLILCLVTCCVCENEVMHITAMTCIHIVETKYHINVQKHFLDNIPQILFFLNIILIFHMSFPNWICGKLKCTIIRYFRHSHLCENLHLQFFNPFKKMWWILTGVYQCRWFFPSLLLMKIGPVPCLTTKGKYWAWGKWIIVFNKIITNCTTIFLLKNYTKASIDLHVVLTTQ